MATPITAEAFANALVSIPFSTLHFNLKELQTSVEHLHQSNTFLADFPNDPDCVDAIAENKQVLDRLKVRIDLVNQAIAERQASDPHQLMEENNSFKSDSDSETPIDPVSHSSNGSSNSTDRTLQNDHQPSTQHPSTNTGLADITDNSNSTALIQHPVTTHPMVNGIYIPSSAPTNPTHRNGQTSLSNPSSARPLSDAQLQELLSTRLNQEQ